MRLARLDLLRFGKFTGRCIEFPGSGLDFHFIVGPNEAGKSTIRAAITDLLFGIEQQSTYDFVHGYADMRLGASLDRGDARIEFGRVKRAKNPLRDADDKPLRDDLLVPFLAGMDRRSFERMFCLDHEGLLQGGADILNAKDDVARLLFEASSGITGFGRLRDALEAEAKTLWDKRRSGERKFYRALDELREAEQLLKQATVRAKDWVDLEQRAQDAREAYAASRRALDELETRRTRLERIRRVAPHLQKLRADSETCARLAGTVRLGRGAREDLERAEREIAAAEALLARAERASADTERRMREITVDEACIEHAEQIRSLAEQRVHTQRYERDIRACRMELRVKLEEAESIARQLGWSGSPDELERMLPPQTARAAIQELLQEHGQLAEAVSAASQALLDRQVEIDTLTLQLESCADEPVPAQLQGALEAARGLAIQERHTHEARVRVQQLQGRIERALQELHPWTGDVESLRALAPPTDSEGRAHPGHEQALATRLQVLRDELHRTRDELASQRLKMEQLRQARGFVTQDDVRHARRERDELWIKIRNGEIAPEGAARSFESRVAEADRVADLRYAGAADVAVLEQLTASVAQHELRLAQQESAAAELAEELRAHRAAWAERMRRIGLAEASASQFLEWSQRRASVLELSESLPALKAELDELVAAAERVRSDLQSGLEACGAAPQSDAPLSQLMASASAVIRRIEERRARRAALLEQRQVAAATLHVLRSRAERAQADMARWEQAWESRLAAARLPPGSARLAVSQALDLFSSLAASLKEIRDLQRNRIDVMQRELDAFAALTAQLAGRLAPQLAGQPPDQIASELEKRLAAAVRGADALEALRAQMRAHRAEIEQAHQQREQARALIQPLMAQSGARSIAELRAAIERSEALYKAEEALETSRSACLQGGDGLTLEQLQAEAAAEDIATIPAQLSQIATELSRLSDEQNAAVRSLAECEQELRRCAGQADAATAESLRQEALSTMASTIERYIKVTIAARLLRWSIDRYREDKQAPLLRRASQIFSILTRGSFERLTVDFDDRAPALKGCRPDGSLVDVEGMSDGTRDQLFLALRLAALELQLAQGRALPFIADDLFINFDDDRAAAGFEALAELATHTQVIFLTHHGHLLPIVEATLGKPINVVCL